MMTTFSVTWDYRCPFARNAHEHIVVGLDVGRDAPGRRQATDGVGGEVGVVQLVSLSGRGWCA